MIIEVDISTFLHGASGSAVPQNLAGYIDQTKWTAITNSIRGAHSQASAMACFLELGICIIFAFPCIFCCHPFVVNITSQDSIRGSLRQLNSAYFNGVEVLSSTRTGFFTVNTDRINGVPSGAQVKFISQQAVPASYMTCSQPAAYAQPQTYAQQAVPASYITYSQPQSYAQPAAYAQPQIYAQQPTTYAQHQTYTQPTTYAQPQTYATQPYYNTSQESSIQYGQIAATSPNDSSPAVFGTLPVPVHPYSATAPQYDSTPQAAPLSEFLLTIPPGAVPGSTMSVVNPHGMTIQVAVPPGAKPGSQMLIKY